MIKHYRQKEERTGNVINRSLKILLVIANYVCYYTCN